MLAKSVFGVQPMVEIPGRSIEEPAADPEIFQPVKSGTEPRFAQTRTSTGLDSVFRKQRCVACKLALEMCIVSSRDMQYVASQPLDTARVKPLTATQSAPPVATQSAPLLMLTEFSLILDTFLPWMSCYVTSH